MKTRQFKVTTLQGVTRIEDFIDTEGACEIALRLYLGGERNPQLNAVVKWLTELGRMPTDEEFMAFVPTIGAQLTKVDAANIDN